MKGFKNTVKTWNERKNRNESEWRSGNKKFEKVSWLKSDSTEKWNEKGNEKRKSDKMKKIEMKLKQIYAEGVNEVMSLF